MWGKYGNQIVYSNDGTLAFVAGAEGRIYVVDSQTLSVVHTIRLANGLSSRIGDLQVVDGWLYVSERDNSGQGYSRLMRININQLSVDFLREQQRVQFSYDAPFGFADMAVNNGSYLALTAPKARDSISRSSGSIEAGNVYVIDLGKIDRETGLLDSNAVTTIKGSDFPSYRGKSPQYITSGNQNGEFLLSSGKDYNDGVVAITVGTDTNGNLDQKFTLTKPVGLSPRYAERPDTNYLSRRMQENIQRAAGNVIVDVDGIEQYLQPPCRHGQYVVLQSH